MPEDRSLGRKPFHRLVQFVKRNIVSDVPEPLLPIQNGLDAVVAKPHGLTRCGSS